MAKSIPGQLSMFNPTTSEGSSSATSSPGSEAGATRSDSQDGLTIDLSGRAVVPVSRGLTPTCGKGGGEVTPIRGILWPAWFRLIEECRPHTIFGEQVAAAARRGWLDEVFSDLERTGYACGPIGLPASSVGADHGRRRIWFVADASGERREGYQPVECVFVAAPAPLAIPCDQIVRARRAVAGDYRDLLPCDGLSVQLERDALKGYGNAIVPQVAAEFIGAYMDICDA